MTLLESLDTQALLLINGFHTELLDTVMLTITNRWFWVPFYILVAAYIYKEKKAVGALWCIVSIALAVALADQIGASVIRDSVARLRPSNPNNPISSLVHIVNDYRGGRYGFPSCHAANSFALAVFMWLTFRKKAIALIFFPWAILQCYTRAYLGVHYPGDLLVGAALGSTCAYVVYFTPRYIRRVLADRVEFLSMLIRRGFFGNLTING